jgi:hypothetical protein
VVRMQCRLSGIGNDNRHAGLNTPMPMTTVTRARVAGSALCGESPIL